MTFLRRISTRKLLALCAAVVVLVIGATVGAIAATGGGSKPPPKRLPVAIHDALTATPVAGVTPRVQFTNDLISGDDVQGSDPLLTGATGRLWATADGRLRLELQSDLSNHGATGDSQVLVSHRNVTVYDAGMNTAYEGTLPKQRASHRAKKESVPPVARIQKGLARAARRAIVSGAVPSDV